MRSGSRRGGRRAQSCWPERELHPCCIGSAAERKTRLCSRTAASTPSILCWRAGDLWARGPCSVLLSGSASSTPCGGCCDRQADLERMRRWWASCVAHGQIS